MRYEELQLDGEDVHEGLCTLLFLTQMRQGRQSSTEVLKYEPPDYQENQRHHQLLHRLPK